MSLRPLVLVAGLTLGDYLLWHWSLGARHDGVALASGLTLPPLGLACIWLTLLLLTRVLARQTRSVRRAPASARASRTRRGAGARERATGASAVSEPASSRAAEPTSGKLAA